MIELPQSILDLPVDEQLAALPPLMQAYLRNYNGACPFFGWNLQTLQQREQRRAQTDRRECPEI